MIPFLDLNKVNGEYQEEINKAVYKVINSRSYLLGEELNNFEKEYAEYNNVKYCVGVGSGLDALSFLMLAADIKKGDEVIVPSHTFIATWLSITNIGAIPIPIEPDQYTYNINPKLIKRKITKKTKAIVVVNLYGLIADLEPISRLIKENDLFLFEDAAQSHGAKYKNKNTTFFSDGAAISFYPTKNLGCMGDGGAIITNNKKLAEKVKLFRNYGSIKKYQHLSKGFNSRLDEIQSAILRVKLKYLDKMNNKRNEIAKYYLNNLDKTKLILPINQKDSGRVWHLFVIRTKKRDYLQKKLYELGIQTIIHYPTPAHKQKCYRNFKFQPLPITENICSEILSLPLYPNMPKYDYEYVVSKVNEYSN